MFSELNFGATTVISSEKTFCVSYKGSAKGTLICTGPLFTMALLIAVFIKLWFTWLKFVILLLLSTDIAFKFAENTIWVSKTFYWRIVCPSPTSIKCFGLSAEITIRGILL